MCLVLYIHDKNEKFRMLLFQLHLQNGVRTLAFCLSSLTNENSGKHGFGTVAS